ncbi:hypothetical protein [Haloarcula onubensis]|uniref:Uncharacterized protein n=1 Tax=Haloarcula onubensis TaxID=2950539 RepID=A0ABU2FT84_9EURY|nr:hypothetical protein [Halomicroarcula sp. S3CR25-11]MDS0283371.1 hypothetical protein [Halomicroarcula sp. S3CR25-11]
MTHRHTLLVVSVAVAMLVSPTIMAQETATATRTAENESGETAGMGAQLTAFTQSSAAAANDSIENGMWKAGFDQSNASDRARLVRERAGSLEGRLERLQRENETLRERYENGSLPQPAYVARQSRLSARIDALRTAINDTDEAASRAGVNDSRLEGLRRNASDLTGPEVAAIARGLGGGPPADRGPPTDRGERGPPEDRGPSAGASNGGPSDGERGPPANRTQGGATGADGGANATDGVQGSNAANGTNSADGAAGGRSAGGSNGATDGQRDDTNGRSHAGDDGSRARN